ncbi:DUF6199 family natural product biosynthesis protein [Saccharibacillus sp. JS10]|uniref:DUF6199 family natural product biosynthesis protein n=1 Tax=Saccharibacillus sp. JS10 TaxID=2950552 RepID=UPI00210996D3|nr:DUF6199 family natural product biosynthesis protein [Saccharibacillus sp. JS10]MCQ4086208.1 hypothetical protein [Saccharibacillus sp. JS10]
MFLFFLILVAIGAVNVLTPQWVWRIRQVIPKSETSEPNPSFMVWSQLAGMIALIGAVLILSQGL